jgi:hypothetical protein
MPTIGKVIPMDILRKVISAEARYKHDIPYIYEARVKIQHNKEEYSAYIADTLCALVEHLGSLNIAPDEAEIYAIFKQGEKGLNINFCVAKDGQWLQLCRSGKDRFRPLAKRPVNTSFVGMVPINQHQR